MAFVAHDRGFADIVGPNPSLELLLTFTDYPFAHEAGVFFPGKAAGGGDLLFVTSNRFCLPGSDEQIVRISAVSLGQPRTPATTVRTELRGVSEAISTGNGGVNYACEFLHGQGGPEEEEAVLFCAQGSRTEPSCLCAMQVAPPHAVRRLVADFYGRPFNSVNDVVVARTPPAGAGSIWFTDPPYGYEQGYRDAPQLPGQVYRYVPGSGLGPGRLFGLGGPTIAGQTGGSIRAMADGLGHPNGICFSPDEATVYVTDTDRMHGSGRIDGHRAATIYAYDVVTRAGQPFLANRRLFAMTDCGIPDGIKCDTPHGNVYSGCGDGVHVWSPGGVLLGRILVDGGAANFCFGRNGELFILNETRLWRAQLAGSLRGALLGL